MTEYLIKITDEKGISSWLNTGISKWYKPEYLVETLEYYQACNPTKQFTLIKAR